MATAVQPANRFAQMRNWPHLPGGVRLQREVLERRVCTATGQRPHDEEAEQLIFVLLAYIMLPTQTFLCNREVVERRVYTVTGQRPGDEEVEQLIETGESETIFQKAILEQGRGQVCH